MTPAFGSGGRVFCDRGDRGDEGDRGEIASILARGTRRQGDKVLMKQMDSVLQRWNHD